VALIRPVPRKLDYSAALAIEDVLDHRLGHFGRPQSGGVSRHG
jgi:hypothetical protein